MEPLDPHVPVGSAPPTRLAIAAAAAALLLTATGDALLAAVLIGLAAASAEAGAIAVAAVLGTLARFGTTSLAGMAGAQAVLGPALAVRPLVGAVGSTCLALACVTAAAAPRAAAGPPAAPPAPGAGLVPRMIGVVPLDAVPLALLAGLVAAGPSATTLPDGAIRLLGIAAALAAVRFAPPTPRWTAPALAAAGLVLTVLS